MGSADEGFQSRADSISESLSFSQDLLLMSCRYGKHNQVRYGLSPAQKCISGSGRKGRDALWRLRWRWWYILKWRFVVVMDMKVTDMEVNTVVAEVVIQKKEVLVDRVEV
ncbi:hypothetical protein F2Q70_00004343 [Brassica cretica]|uniref:Uncharacterized protein n=1 Tax=Brassica cretica TaxID=69181 RepID=A0A8S9J659_BRACR|nr:hypothetical protein F2Q70_00004343 [Brassica cretica]